MWRLEAGVGWSRPNRPIDVGLVQDLLNLAMPLEAPLPWDGLPSQSLYDRIWQFKNDRRLLKPLVCSDFPTIHPGGHIPSPGHHDAAPDDAVDPAGPTFQALTDNLRESALIPWHRQGNAAYPGSGLVCNPPFVERFVNLYMKQFGAPSAGLTTLTDFIVDDPAIGDIRWAAYMLATAWLETSYTYDPVPERNRGGTHAYAAPVTWDDAAGKAHTHRYYGRGYVQLTWLDNYRRLGADIGVGDKLAKDPSLLLHAATAYQVMSYGMTHGSFTGVGLARFIHDATCDYRGARAIINPHDHADPIAAKAEKIEMLLRLATR